MASREYNVNIQLAGFPFRTDLHPKTALGDEIQGRNEIIPQLLYAENVLPAKEGYDSLDEAAPILQNPAFPTIKFDKVYDFFDSIGNKYLFSPANGRACILKDGDDYWVPKLNLIGNPKASIAKRKGQTYFYFKGFGAYKYNEGTTNLDVVTLTGLALGPINGITAASNYTIAYADNIIYYTLRDEVANAIDFTPLAGQAGSLSVLAVKGTIIAALPFANGFFLYTKENVISASYSGNVNTPFTFREIPGTSGIIDEENVGWDTNLTAQFAWTRSGLQQISPQGAQNLFPELTDFIRARTLEDFDEATGTMTRTTYQKEFAVKVNVVGHRFVCVSYGPPTELLENQVYLECLIFDLDLQRWGKIKRTHVDIFTYTFTGGVVYLTFNDLAAITFNQLATVRFTELTTQDPGGPNLGYMLAALSLTGQINSFQRSNMNGTGVPNSRILVGRIQGLRGRITQLDEVISDTTALEKMTVYSSVSGDPFVQSTQIRNGFNGTYTGSVFSQRWLFRATARFHNLLLKGKFHLSTLMAWLDDVGDR